MSERQEGRKGRFAVSSGVLMEIGQSRKGAAPEVAPDDLLVAGRSTDLPGAGVVVLRARGRLHLGNVLPATSPYS